MGYRIVRLAGDGIGPEIMDAAMVVAERVSVKHDLAFDFEDALFGGAAVDETGSPFPIATEVACKSADAVLLGAVGGPRWDDAPAEQRPEKGLLGLRKALGTYANIRPVKYYPALSDFTAFRPGHLDGVDLVVVRELTGGIYFGEKSRSEEEASDLCTYSRSEIERIVRTAAEMARRRSGRLVSVDKANVLETSRLWRAVTNEVMADYPDVTLEHMLVDAMAMKLIDNPATYDVIVTENMFGDILTDEASMLAGSIGLLPSASLSTDGPGIFEPIHGSAPDIAGQGRANPFGMIMSFAMMLRTGLDEPDAADTAERAVAAALAAGETTTDLGGPLTTEEAALAVAGRVG